MTTLILVRHGQSEANLAGTFAGQSDVELLEMGIMQAQKTAEYIAEHYKTDIVYASDLKRAYKTGEIIANLTKTKIIPDKNLREIYAGEWQGKKFDALTTIYKEDYSIWLQDIGNSHCTGGESAEQLGERIINALTKIAQSNDGKTVVIALHATPIRVAQCLMSGLTLDSMKNIPWVSNASITEVTYENGEWKFVKIGIDEHLSELKTTFAANV